jgi:hypothetical protein
LVDVTEIAKTMVADPDQAGKRSSGGTVMRYPVLEMPIIRMAGLSPIATARNQIRQYVK